MTQRSGSSATPTPDEVRAMVAHVIDAVLGDTPIDAADPGIPVADSEPVAGSETAAGNGSIAIGADHGGYALKERIAFRLREAGYTVVDVGTSSQEPVDYPDFAHAVAAKVAAGECRWGIAVDGAGIGSAMVANKVPGVRAATCYDISSARNSREHNHANVLCLGAGLTGENLALQIVQEWMDVPWGGGRHARRVEKIADVERRYARSS